jgi:transglutaminase-like putative cysteine protease
VAALAGVTAFALAISGAVFVLLPRAPRPLLTGFAGQPVPTAGFGDEVSLAEHGSEIGTNDEVVLRVEFPTGRPPEPGRLRWRGRSYDHFDGIRWTRSGGLDTPPVPPWWYANRWQGPVVEQKVFAAPVGQPVLFGLHPALSVVPVSDIEPLMDVAGDLRYLGGAAPVYTVYSAAAPPSAEALRQAASSPPAAGAYLQVPPVSSRVDALADSIIGGADNAWDAASALELWFRTEFGYTRELPASAREATLEHFLFERREGHCEYFSSAMAVMLRTAGIPARNVTGFLGGEWNAFGGYLAVSQDRAHSWVEVWFTGFGWVPFDPTPPAVEGAFDSLLRPMRLALDGARHRWNKWVVDYDFERQLAIVAGTADLFRGDGGAPGRGTGLSDAARRMGPLLLAALAIVVLLGYGRRQGGGLQPVTRAYLKLRRGYGRLGYADAARLAPLGFLAALRRDHAPGHAAAERLTRRYMEVRFGGRTADPDVVRRQWADLEEALASARRGRRRGSGRGGAAEHG